MCIKGLYVRGTRKSGRLVKTLNEVSKKEHIGFRCFLKKAGYRDK